MQTLLLECYRYREVLYNILSQDLKIKYRRTFLGYIWSLLNPILQLTVLTIVFSHIVRLGIKDYTLYLFSGLLAWAFFQNSLTAASTSLLEGENFIKRIYLPKMIFPLSKVCLKGIDFFFSLIALSLIGVVIGMTFRMPFLYLPLAILILFIFTLGMALIVSVATVYFRDIQYFTSVFLQLLYFLTPILYPISVLPKTYHPLLYANPLVLEIGLFQKLIYFGQVPAVWEWAAALAVAVASLLMGFFVLVSFDEDLVFRM